MALFLSKKINLGLFLQQAMIMIFFLNHDRNHIGLPQKALPTYRRGCRCDYGLFGQEFEANENLIKKIFQFFLSILKSIRYH